jgi:hypothetical protein
MRADGGEALRRAGLTAGLYEALAMLESVGEWVPPTRHSATPGPPSPRIRAGNAKELVPRGWRSPGSRRAAVRRRVAST